MQRRSRNIHERFLRHIWSKQYLVNDLRTVDGKSLSVLHVGIPNTDAGPDFLNAKIKLNGITYAGDVEIHRTALDWLQHQHQEDPHYNKVVLHVVLEIGSDFPPTFVKSGRQIPVLVLGHFLSESIHAIWGKAILDERAERNETIPCYEKNTSVPLAIIEHWMDKLAVERLELKLRSFEERLKQLAQERKFALYEKKARYRNDAGEIPPPMPELKQKDFSKKELWEQLLYEGLMEGLGYSKNREPFIKLARNASLERIIGWQSQSKECNLEACLFGIAGLLPKMKTIHGKEERAYIGGLKKSWKEFRPRYRGECLHEADWKFFPTRPTNFPTIRIAAAVQLVELVQRHDLFRTIIQLLKSEKSTSSTEKELIDLFSLSTNEFWQHHYDFTKRSAKPITALGRERIQSLILNTVLPVSLLYARVYKENSIREKVFAIYNTLHASENNTITRLVDEQVLKKRIDLKTVHRQQAAIQLYKYYCVECRCAECAIGEAISHVS